MECYSYVFGAFVKFQRATARFVMPGHPHGATQLPPDGLTRNLIFEHFFENTSRKCIFH